MHAVTVAPGVPGSGRLDVLPEPNVPDGEYLIESIAVGVCGTDAEILDGHHGAAPHGADRLVLGHEALGRILEAPAGAVLAPGELVVPIVRRPDPEPCAACAAGEWDMCQNGRYTEHGIQGADGFLRERYPLDPAFAVAVPAALGGLGVLVEPTSVVAKAWEQTERIGNRATWRPRTALVTGAGPIGLLAALLATQRGFETHVLDRAMDGPKPALVADLGAIYHTGRAGDTGLCPDITIECTGVGAVVLDVLELANPSAIVCLTGLSSGGRRIDVDAAEVNRRLVLENAVVFGTVNANRRHYAAAVEALAAADQRWLERLVTRRVPLERWQDGLTKDADDVKVVVDVAARVDRQRAGDEPSG